MFDKFLQILRGNYTNPYASFPRYCEKNLTKKIFRSTLMLVALRVSEEENVPYVEVIKGS